MSPERSRLLQYIDPTLRKDVLEKLPLPYIITYEQRMHQIKRLQNAPHLPVMPGYIETDLDHTCEMLDMLYELRSRAPRLFGAVDFKVTAYMIAMHDAGEIIVGDVPARGPLRENEDGKRRKELEPKAALNRILGQIPDEAVRIWMQHLYHRFATQDPYDREALLTRFLDKAQGTTRTGPKFAFDYRAMDYRHPPYKLWEHVHETTGIFVESALSLYRALPHEAGDEIKRFTVEELNRFRQIGFRRVARDRMSQFVDQTKIFSA